MLEKKQVGIYPDERTEPLSAILYVQPAAAISKQHKPYNSRRTQGTIVNNIISAEKDRLFVSCEIEIIIIDNSLHDRL